MAYAIDRYNNTLLTTVEDGTVDQTTDLKFIGKNYAGYGEIQNENFLFLLENFSGANQPARPVSGQVWFDSGTSKLKFYDGGQWRTTGGAEIGSTEPTGLSNGDFWWNSANDQLYVYNGTSFILIGPQNAGEGVTQMQSIEVLDTTGATRGIISAVIEDETIFVISPGPQFDLGSGETALIAQGFYRIVSGVTLRNTSNNGITNPGDRFNGTATDADKLGGVIATDYARKDQASFASVVTFADAGIQIGDDLDLKIKIIDGINASIQNDTTNGNIQFKVSVSTASDTHVATLTKDGIFPGTNNIFDLGSDPTVAGGTAWANIYATTFRGNATTASALQVAGMAAGAVGNVEPVINTVAVRTPEGNLKANLFVGTATQARYADLAEKYSTAKDLAPGTVVCVSTSTEYEVEPVRIGSTAIGVVSTDPAVMMNSEADGQYIGLKGRLPVKIVGEVNKGDKVYVNNAGCASTEINGGSLVGVALESNSDEAEKLVECALKV